MRKALAILFISLVISTVVFFAIILLPLIKPAEPRVKIPYDRYLSYENYDMMFLLLQKMGYMIITRVWDYDKNIHKCIIFDNNLDNTSFKRFRGWLGRNKRLIVFTGGSNSSRDIGKPMTELKIRGRSPLLEDVKSIEIKRNGGLPLKGFYNGAGALKIEPLITSGTSVLLARTSYKGGEIVYIGDDRIFSDKLLLEKDNAVLLNNLFKDYYHSEIAFDQSAEQSAAPEEKNEYFIAKGAFPYIMLQLCLLAAAFFLANFKRFGNVLDYNRYKKRSIKNHLEAAGNFLSSSANQEALSKILDDYFYERISRIFPGKNQDELPDFLVQRYGSRADPDIFKRNKVRNIAKIEEGRRKFIKIMGKGV